jgi:hypothetical protein
MEIFYNWDGKFHFEKGFVDGVFTYLWQVIHNVQAVRNRKKIVVSFLKKEKPNMIVSLGSGSARAILDSLKYLPNGVEILLIDPSTDALDYSKELCEKDEYRGVALCHNFHRHKAFAQNFKKFVPKNFTGKIFFEMAGLLDNERSFSFFKSLSSFMRSGDVFCVSNIIPNRERPFVEKIVHWPKMYYRQPTELIELLLAGGFKEEEIEIFLDATSIYSIALVRKQ